MAVGARDCSSVGVSWANRPLHLFHRVHCSPLGHDRRPPASAYGASVADKTAHDAIHRRSRGHTLVVLIESQSVVSEACRHLVLRYAIHQLGLLRHPRLPLPAARIRGSKGRCSNGRFSRNYDASGPPLDFLHPQVTACERLLHQRMAATVAICLTLAPQRRLRRALTCPRMRLQTLLLHRRSKCAAC